MSCLMLVLKAGKAQSNGFGGEEVFCPLEGLPLVLKSTAK